MAEFAFDRDPVSYILKLEAAARPTVGDALAMGALQRKLIMARTAAHVDAEGAPFAPYSPSYLKRKVKHGGSAQVDLYGFKSQPRMMRSMKVRTASAELDAGMEANADPWANSQPLMFGFEVGMMGDDRISQRARVHNDGGIVKTRLGQRSSDRGTSFKGRKHKSRKGAVASYNMPRRHFLDSTELDRQLMIAVFEQRQMERVNSI